jgi:hypothetical protein
VQRGWVSPTGHLHAVRIDELIIAMKHELLGPIWRIRDRIAKECGHDLQRLAERIRLEEQQRLAPEAVRPPKAAKLPSRKKHRVPTV